MRRIGTPIALAGYLLATIAASLHQHDHSHVHFDISSAAAKPADTCEHVHVGCSHTHAHNCSHSHGDEHLAGSGHHHHHHDGAPTHHHHGGIPLHDDDCAVCQFHAVQYVSTPAVAVVGLFETIKLPEPLDVLRPQVPTLSRPLSRGPPVDVIA